MKKKQVKMMVFNTTKFKLNQLFQKNNSTEPKPFCQIIMKQKKLWKCIKNYINGMNLLKLLKKKDTLNYKN